MQSLGNRRDLFIGGSFVHSSSHDFVTLVNPSTEETIGSVPCADADDVESAVKEACAAVLDWRSATPADRAGCLLALAREYEKRAPEMGALVSQQNGSPLWWTKVSTEAAPVSIYQAAADMAAELETEEVVASAYGRSIIRNEAVGVVGAIVPWNAPQSLLAMKLGPALAAGCSVVVKPSPETSFDAYLLADAIQEAGIPPGVVNILTGGRETGELLVTHPRVDKISFTGSTSAGRRIASVCGEQLKPLSAELGGKSAVIILDDANLGQFEEALYPFCLPYSGQVCYAWTRVLVHKTRYSDLMDVLLTKLQSASVGDAANPDTIFGPLVTARQRARVEAYVESGLKQGATLALGGRRPDRISRGFFLEPTVFVDVDPNMDVFQQEIFGPVLVVSQFDSDDEAVRLANNSTYGLSGAVFGNDVERATSLARQVESGRVMVNGAPSAPGLPMIGLKDSGLGREGMYRAAENYQYIKNITQPLARASE